MTIDRKWQKGDVLTMHLSMTVLQIVAHPNVTENIDRIALQRGPLVYCLEQVDNGRHMKHMVLTPKTTFTVEQRDDLLNGITVIKGKGRVRNFDKEESDTMEITAVPYYAWDNRQGGAMAVWLPENPEAVRPVPEPTIAGTW